LDIKLKNKNSPIISFVLALVLITVSLSALFGFQNNKRYLTLKSYFESNEFNSSLSNFFDKFINYNIEHKDYTSKSIDEKISLEEITRLKIQYADNIQFRIEKIENQYRDDIYEAEKEGSKDRLTRLIEERDRKLEDTKKEYTKSIDDIKRELANESDIAYKNLEKDFKAIADIKYYIKDNKTNILYTNLNYSINIDEYIKSNSVYNVSFPRNSYGTPYLKSLNSRFAELSLEGYLIIPQSSAYIYDYGEYNKGRLTALFQLLAIFLASSAGVYLLRYAKTNKIDSHQLITTSVKLYSKVPSDLKFALFVFAVLLAPEIYGDKSIFQSGRLSDEFAIVLVFITAFTFYFYISIPEIIKSIKNKEEFKKQFKLGIIYKLKEFSSSSLKDRTILFKSFVYTGAWLVLIIIFIFISNFNNELFLALLLLYFVITFVLLIIGVNYIDRIVKGTDEIVKGNLQYVIMEKGSGSISRLAHNINNMKSGINKALEAQLKSDRLKSELITNVSHDLKTPLTSIISYVDLLKKDDLSKDELQAYVSVLDRKTQRLKVLIQDLFEASKMASGAVDLNIEKVDVAQLLRQSLAEFDEKITQSGLTFKINIPPHKVYAELDGKKTWRVFENLIGNILKYSQPNTRVYIELLEAEASISIVMKNISSYEMDFQIDEIFERFKRGDASRATEGSGLGLAIAKSIVDIQGGRLNIEIDGDLFKAIVEFNKQ
jgi:signal transduction histidine kinase